MATQPDGKTKKRTRRHPDFGPQNAARETYLSTRGPAARRRRAQERADARAKLSPSTKLRRLRARIKRLNEQQPGLGGSATREIGRLKAQLTRQRNNPAA